jgi:hypothetical protein
MKRLEAHPNMMLEKAAWIACHLIYHFRDPKVRWKVLAEVWADILVHTAPSWNAAAHKKCLATGGEFITHIWVILSHCNIQSSKRWPRQESPQDAQEGAEGQAGGEENQAPPQQEPAAGAENQAPPQQEPAAAAITDDASAPSSGTPPQQDNCAAETSNPIPEQHLIRNGHRNPQGEEEIQEVGADWKE